MEQAQVHHPGRVLRLPARHPVRRHRPVRLRLPAHRRRVPPALRRRVLRRVRQALRRPVHHHRLRRPVHHHRLRRPVLPRRALHQVHRHRPARLRRLAPLRRALHQAHPVHRHHPVPPPAHRVLHQAHPARRLAPHPVHRALPALRHPVLPPHHRLAPLRRVLHHPVLPPARRALHQAHPALRHRPVHRLPAPLLRALPPLAVRRHPLRRRRLIPVPRPVPAVLRVPLVHRHPLLLRRLPHPRADRRHPLHRRCLRRARCNGWIFPICRRCPRICATAIHALPARHCLKPILTRLRENCSQKTFPDSVRGPRLPIRILHRRSPRIIPRNGPHSINGM